MTKPRPASQAAVDKAGEVLIAAIGQGTVDDLRVHAHSRKFWVPSVSHPDHEYRVHVTDSDKRNSCTCEGHKRRYTRPCKHILALKIVLGL
jgi:hypothetical protein